MTATGHHATDDGVLVCVDAGTTMIKAVAFDRSGRELAVASLPTAVSTPGGGRSEQDMDEVWAAFAGTVRDVAEAASAPVRALAFTAQGDGAWLVDDRGRPTHAAMLWNDARAADVVDRWRRDGTLDEVFRRTGMLGNAGLPHAILTALAAEEPDVLARSQAALTCGGWLFLRLTGTLGMDRSEASNPWIDLTTGTTSAPLLELHGLGGSARLIPPLLERGDLVQGLTSAAADELGLPVDTPVVLTPYDIVAAAIGSGAVRPGQALTILGTTLCTESIIAAADAVPQPGSVPAGLTVDLDRDGLFLRAFPTLAGTGVVDWSATLLGLPDAAAVGELAATAPAGAGGVQVLPYLSPAGERAPFLDPRARGVVSGVSFDHGREHIARAVFEGLGHVVRDCLDAIPGAPAELRLSGGGAASELWTQIIADISDRDVVRTADAQVGAKGALIVALVALGEYPDLAAAADALVRVRDRRAPDPARRAMYEDRHHEFLELRETIAPTWHRAPAGVPGRV